MTDENKKDVPEVLTEVIEEVANDPTPAMMPPASSETSFLDTIPIETQLLLFKVKSANFEISAINNSLNTFNEMHRRATIETQTIPGKIEETRKVIAEKQVEGKKLYDSLKAALNCPSDKELNLDTGEFI